VIKGSAMCVLPGSVGVACSSMLSVSLEGMGFEPVLNLAANPDEAVSIVNHPAIQAGSLPVGRLANLPGYYEIPNKT
jgi:hypothetical protein